MWWVARWHMMMLVLFLYLGPVSLVGQGRPRFSTWLSLDAYCDTPFQSLPAGVTNPGAFARQQDPALQFITEQRFLLSGLQSFQLSAVLPTSAGNWGFIADQEGYDIYQRLSTGISYVRELHPAFHLGASFRYVVQKFSGIHRQSVMQPGIGFLLQLNSNLRMGFHYINPVRLYLTAAVPMINEAQYAAGIGWRIAAGVSLSAEWMKQWERPLMFSIGLLYKPVPLVQLRLGAGDGLSTYYSGVSLLLPACNVELATHFHPYLGASPSLRIWRSFKKKQE